MCSVFSRINAVTMLWIFCILPLIQVCLAQVSCPGLGDFFPVAPFTGWPDPTCPGDTGLELDYRMFNRRDRLGRDFDRSDVPFIFEPELDTIFLIHGHGQNERSDWLRHMRDELMDEYDVNVVVVGWGGPDGAEDGNYWRAASDTRTVGAETAEVMINLVVSGGGSSVRMILVGHGLGAHVAGHAGRWAGNNAATPQRCTGLNPAGPHFINNTNREVGLYRDCANFVDVIHTDRIYGSTPLEGGVDVFLGNQDFFPNGGHSQPGCGDAQCNHDRAIDLFYESIANNCMGASAICAHSGFIPESCDICSVCPMMGYHASPGPVGRFHLTTSSTGPYC